MSGKQSYVGIHEDLYGGMTDIGKIIRDAWAFGLIPEEETCAGWRSAAIESLWEKVQTQWSGHGYSVNRLPAEIRRRYERIQSQAISRAQTLGWNPELDIDEG
jgi:hypothetical protein